MVLLAALSLLILPASDGGNAGERVVLENGLTVFFWAGKSPSSSHEIPMHLCFPSGRVLEPQPGASEACLTQVQEFQAELSPGFFRATFTWVEDEVCGFSFTILPDDSDGRLPLLAKRLWISPPDSQALSYTQMGGCIPPPRTLSIDDFLPAMLRRSRYASIERNFPEIREFSNSLRGFRGNLFHPRQALLLVEARRSAELEKRIRKAFDIKVETPFSMSYSIVEETPHLSERGKAIFASGVLRPRMAVVFPAPGRGSEDAPAFAGLWQEAAERFGSQRVHAWSGLGVGLFWIEYECSESRFGEVFLQFVKTVEDFRDEILTGLAPREPLGVSSPLERTFSPERALAARHFWGAGVLDEDPPAVNPAQLRDVASRFLRRPAFFALWPESRKDEWKGFP